MLQDICHNLNFKQLYIDLTLAKMKKQINPESSPMNTTSYTEEDNLEFQVLLDGHSLNILPNTTNAIENNQDSKKVNNIQDTSEVIEIESENFNEQVFIIDVGVNMEYLNEENVIIENVIHNMDIDASCPTDDTSLNFDNINEESPNNEVVMENQIGSEETLYDESMLQNCVNSEESNTNKLVLENNFGCEKSPILKTVIQNHVESEENLEENSEF